MRKMCTVCHRLKPSRDYYYDKSKRAWRPDCKDCTRQRNRDYWHSSDSYRSATAERHRRRQASIKEGV